MTLQDIQVILYLEIFFLQEKLPHIRFLKTIQEYIFIFKASRHRV